ALAAVRDACRPGATGADLVAAWRATGAPVPAAPIAYGVGLGMERPVIGDDVGADEVLAAGMVLALTSWVVADGVGGHLERDLVLVTDRGPELLTRSGRGPAGGGNR
ncbi:MAG: Xaa-Pro aminopeptidase, partial [Actinomycetia bacterium]|nr:Xaa-Pro aminopeptidase [Actinomycetes bacterium]